MPNLIPDIMGKSPKSLRVFKEIKRVSRLDAAVLISGDKGCRKDLIARAIHDNSPRSKGPFIAVDLASIPRDSAERELFGTGGPIDSGGVREGRIGDAEGGA